MSVFLFGALFTLVFFSFVFFIAIQTDRIDLADIIWGPGFIVAMLGGVVGYLVSGGTEAGWSRFIFIFIATSIWATRLSWHIGKRFIKKGQEDARYQKMRQNWKEKWVLNTFLYVYMLQGFLMLVIVSANLWVLNLETSNHDVELGPIFCVGFILWCVGFFFEFVSDKQMEKFKSDSNNKGQLIKTGLWRYSQHPNYFGEVTLWWGIYLMSYVELSSLWFIISPLTITYLILKVSGIPLLREYLESRPGYDEYARKTSKFFPWMPKP